MEEHILFTVLGLLLIFLAVIFIRALAFKPPKSKVIECDDICVDAEEATKNLAEMIKCKTISDTNKENEDEEEFDKFKKLLPQLFPAVYKKCIYEEPGERSILLKWEGENHDNPTVLMSHYDVVSVVEEKWEKPAFDGILEDGVLWGRGTLDTKATLNAALTSAETLIKQGFTPKNDIYFAFGGDEEINGHGSKDIVNLFKSRGIKPGLVLDEGGAVIENVFPGVKSPVALIGISEKGALNVEYSISGGGGHASSPAPHTPVGMLSAACVKIENHPFKFRISKSAAEMFDTLGRHSTFLYRLIFANLWCFSPVLDLLTRSSGGEFNATVRTTVAFTQMEGSKGMNVIPPQARMVSNIRLNSGDTIESALEYLRKVVKNDKIEIREIYGTNPSVISTTKCAEWQKVKDAISLTWSDAIVSAYPMIAASDSRHWGEISDKVYRFSAMALTKEERATIHGNNERITVDAIVKTVKFYTRIIKNC